MPRPLPLRTCLFLFAPLLALASCDKIAASAGSSPSGDPAASSSAAPEEETVAEPAVAPAPLARPDATLIPRTVLFGADHVRVRISPDGKELGWLAPVRGVRNVWVAPVDALGSARPVTTEATRHIRFWDWAPSSGQLYYLMDRDGDEDNHVLFVDLASSQTRDLTPGEGVRSAVERMSHKDPRHIVLGDNARDPRVTDLYKVDVTTGERALLAENPGDYASYTIDDRLRVVGAHRANPDGSLDVLSLDEKKGTRSVLVHVPFLDVGGVDLYGRDQGLQFMRDSRGRDTSALVAVDAKTGATTVLADDPRVDLGNVVARGKPLAASFHDERTRWQVVDPAAQADFDYLARLEPGDMAIDSRSADDARWVVSYRTESQPRVFYLFDRVPGGAGHATRLFSASADLARLTLPRSEPVVLSSRDGLRLVSYLTLPLSADAAGTGRPDHPLPMVLWVHGGPVERELPGFDDTAQWLANRGYAVLKVNFRGSAGFGKAFLNAGNGEYGEKMQDDLEDAVAWAVQRGVADPTRVAIMGPSYGGYAALVGLTKTPKAFACGVDLYGMPDLLARLQTIPYTSPSGAWDTRRMGDPDSPAGRAHLVAESPITHVAALERPLLVFQGAHDPKVQKPDVDRFIEATRATGAPVTYVVFPDEGHGWSRPENILTYAATTEIFLARCLGGSYQPLGDDGQGSSWTVPVGAEHVPMVE